MSDRVGVMAQGVMQQFASPEDIYHRPATGFVASFIGKPNRLRRQRRDAATGQGGTHAARRRAWSSRPRSVDASRQAREVDCLIRQEAIELRSDARRGAGKLHAGTVALRSFSGARVQYVVRLADGVELVVEAPSQRRRKQRLRPDAPVCARDRPGRRLRDCAPRERAHDVAAGRRCC